MTFPFYKYKNKLYKLIDVYNPPVSLSQKWELCVPSLSKLLIHALHPHW